MVTIHDRAKSCSKRERKMHGWEIGSKHTQAHKHQNRKETSISYPLKGIP